MSALKVITTEQLRALRESGFVVVHSDPPESMWKAGASARNGYHLEQSGCWHRMIAESIRLQNEEVKG